MPPKDLDESVTDNGLNVHVYIESGPPVSVKRSSNGIPTYLQMNIFNSLWATSFRVGRKNHRSGDRVEHGELELNTVVTSRVLGATTTEPISASGRQW